MNACSAFMNILVTQLWWTHNYAVCPMRLQHTIYSVHTVCAAELKAMH